MAPELDIKMFLSIALLIFDIWYPPHLRLCLCYLRVDSRDTLKQRDLFHVPALLAIDLRLCICLLT